MRPLIQNGYVYIAQPPLYKVDYRGKQYYCYNDEQLEKLKVDLISVQVILSNAIKG